MPGKFLTFMIIAVLSVNIYGCATILIGAAGGVGTAAWLSNKLTQEVNAPFERTVKAAKSALKSLKLKIEKETIEPDVAQIISRYTDGKKVWIDVRRVTDSSSKVEVRVGAVSADKEAEVKILKAIEKHL
jgi:hypothetical protein